MPDPLDYLSRGARVLRESAIRRATDLESAVPDLISLGGGFPDPTVFPWDEVREIAQSILTGKDATVLQYGLTRGYRPLLEALTAILESRGIKAATDEVIVTTGSQQGLDLCARVFVDPGDTVLVELPAYTGGITAFSNQQARLVGVRQDDEGIDLADLDRVVSRERAEGHRIALVYVVPNFQNPTGLLMSASRRQRLLEWAGTRSVLIVEDDPYGALYFDDVATSAESRPIKADDQDGRVIYLSTFSKTAAPGLRVAWIAGPAPILARMEIAKQSADLCTGSLDQRLVYELYKRGTIDRRLPLLRECYQRKRVSMEAALKREMRDLVSWTTPKGGFFLWAMFRDGLNTDVLLRRAISHGVLYVPGSAFYVDAHGGAEARLSFSAPTPERIETAINRLAAAAREALATSSAEQGAPDRPPSDRASSDRASSDQPLSDQPSSDRAPSDLSPRPAVRSRG
jgi:2-aminoadipate transaminase